MLPETADVLMTLRNKIRLDMNNFTDDIATGANIADFSAYKYMTGVIAGLAYAERHLHDLVEAARRGEDDADADS